MGFSEKGICVSIADDHEVHRLAASAVASSQATVLLADNGAESVALVTAGGVDLMPMDFEMPVMVAWTRRSASVESRLRPQACADAW